MEIEIHTSRFGLDYRDVAQLLQRSLHVAAGQHALDASQSRVLAAPFAGRAHVEIGAGDGQLLQANAVVQFDENRPHVAVLPFTPAKFRSVEIDRRDTARIAALAGTGRGRIPGRLILADRAGALLPFRARRQVKMQTLKL